MLVSFRKAPNQKISEHEAAFRALDKVQAIIWFDPNGNILEANENFLDVMGYSADEIVGKHHQMFVEPEEVKAPRYAEFWERLGAGEFVSGEFARIAKDGSTIYIEASYNPILDKDGAVEKIVKFAVDVTEKKGRAIEAEGQIAAISRSQAVIEFKLDGTIMTANENFLSTLGYSLDEVKGQHHRMFVDADYAASSDYKAFWEDLAAGQFKSSEFRRIKKGGDTVWIQASYNPIFDHKGRPCKIVKYATDITDTKLQAADFAGKIEAISRSQAVIEFEVDGSIVDANENFLKCTGYRLDEIKGRSHAMFVAPEYASSVAFRQFWADLAKGDVKADQFKRIAKDGREIWLQASYNPIFGPDGKPYRVVKYATDVTAFKQELGLVIDSLTALSQGDLTQRMTDQGSPDFAEMRKAFNGTLDRLAELVGDIDFSASSILEESEAIADSANDLSARCERQAATVEETSASMEEMSSTVRSNAENAKEATAAAQNATNHAEQGGVIVQDAISAMGKIEEGSAEVRKIIEVIDAIAFQTNLLALNAGVEAARAGEAGSGFAVVASEVRALAQRASESARDISALIETSEKQVSEGAALVKKTGDALEEIVTAVTRVSSGIDGIFTASSEQASGVTEINQAMTEIDATTQKTAAISEESTAAAASLAQRALSLRDLISFFQVASRSAKPVEQPRSEPSRNAPEAKQKAPESSETVSEETSVPAVKAQPVQEVVVEVPPVKQPVVQGALAAKSAIDDDDWREF